jgi:hypothetical protein
MPYNEGLPNLFELISNPQDWVQTYGYHTYYRGVVIDNKDPECRGRVKVRVEEIWKSSPKEQNDQTQAIAETVLPWAEVLIHGQNNKSGLMYVPPVGTYVIVAFEKGHDEFPILLGGWFARDEIPLAARGGDQGKTDTAGALKGQDANVTTAGGGSIEEPDNPYAAEYPENIVLRTTSGHLVELDNTKDGERINIAHKSGTWVEFHPDGTLVFGIQGKKYTVVEGDDGEHVKGNQDVVVDGDGTYRSGGDYTQEVTGAYTQDLLTSSTVEVSGNSTYKAANVTVEAQTTMELKATLLDLGPGPARGDVVTTLTHPIDYITGIPILGTPFVKAG